MHVRRRLDSLWCRLVDPVERRKARGTDHTSFEISADDAYDRVADSALASALFQPRSLQIYKWCHYIEAYDAQFQGFCGRPVRLLELGVFHGGSLPMWRDYLGPSATVFGIDLNPDCERVGSPGVTIRIGSQADPDFLRSVVTEMGGIDIVIDDCSHVGEHQRVSFETLFPLLSDGGMYVVEDVHTSYWRDFGGGYGRSDTFIEYSKGLLDDMHAWYRGRSARTPIDAARTVESVTFYDSIVFIRKRAKERPANFLTDGRDRSPARS